MTYKQLEEKKQQLESVRKDIQAEYTEKLELINTDLSACMLAMGYGDYGHLLDKWYIKKDEGTVFYPVRIINRRGFYEIEGVMLECLFYADYADTLIRTYSVAANDFKKTWKAATESDVMSKVRSRIALVIAGLERPEIKYLSEPSATQEG